MSSPAEQSPPAEDTQGSEIIQHNDPVHSALHIRTEISQPPEHHATRPQHPQRRLSAIMRSPTDAYEPRPTRPRFPPRSLSDIMGAPTITSEVSQTRKRRASTASRHDPRHGDMSFPFATTDTARAGMTDEYRERTATGLVEADLELKPIMTRTSVVPAVLQDREKALELKSYRFVTWLEDDDEDPRNWSDAYRWFITFVATMSVVQVAFASAVITPGFDGLQTEFRVSEVVMALSVSLMVVGFGTGPLIWSPLSELYGRRMVWIVPFFLYFLFNIPCALAKNIETLLVCRFLCGFFGSVPLTLAGGVIADVWDNNERGLAIALFAAAPYGAPVLSQIVGGFVYQAVGWRWLLWVNQVFAGVIFVLLVFVPETFAPVLLRRRAAVLRKEMNDDKITTEQELFHASVTQMLIETLVRPFEMLFTEPILLLLSLYIALIYGLLYAFFFSFPIVFSENYQWIGGQVGLAFCSVLVGLAFALVVTPLLEQNYLKRAAMKSGKADPEDRLVGMMIAAPCIPISLFIFGWTAPGTVMPGGGHWVGPVSAGIPFGFGMVIVYFSANAYLIDAFPGYVASALAAKTVVRSGLGAAMPLFIPQMFHALGNGWAASLLGLVAIVMVPIPFLFYMYGWSIRAQSKRAAA